MTQSKAAAVANALIAAGYTVAAGSNGAEWWVSASSPTAPVNLADAQTFAASQAVTGTVDRVTFT